MRNIFGAFIFSSKICTFRDIHLFEYVLGHRFEHGKLFQFKHAACNIGLLVGHCGTLFGKSAIILPDCDSIIPTINKNITTFLPCCGTSYETTTTFIFYPKCYILDSSHFLHSPTVVRLSQFPNSL